jgi:hypothetical protein
VGGQLHVPAALPPGIDPPLPGLDRLKSTKLIILPFVLYGCETWSLTLKENMLRMFGNGMLKRIFVLKIEDVT